MISEGAGLENSPWSAEFERLVRARCPGSGAPDPFDPDATFSSLGVDSIGLLGILVDSEDAFDIEIPLEILTNGSLVTPRTFWAALHPLVDHASKH